MPKLVIVESPTKAKTLASFLGKDYNIKASMGHIRDLPKSGLGVDVEHNFEPQYEVPSKSKKVLAEIKNAAKDADSILLATDPDREGEAISWHLQQLLENKKVKHNYQRVVFHELTKPAIEEAFNNPGQIDINLVDSQQARRVLDRLVGYKLSPLLWKKVRFGLSAGRVQSVAVRLIVEKETERQAFKPEEYWSVTGTFMTKDKRNKFDAELKEKDARALNVKSSGEAKKIHNELKDDTFLLEKITKTERKRNPYPPLKTSTLQQSMANMFGFSAKKTMSAAQKLFEKGYITYHRTDSLNLSPSFAQSARKYIEKEFGKAVLPDKPVFYKTSSKHAQEAHEAIRPTDVSGGPKLKSKLTGDELKVYTVIWKRALECQMLPAVYDQTLFEILSEKGYVFKATGSVVKFDGWLLINKQLGLQDDNGDVSTLPDITPKTALLAEVLNADQHFTQPPARYSDASLIKKLEELGVGRPSTYAPTISTIQDRGYITKEGRYFVPNDVAYVVINLLVTHFPDVVDYKFTADMEEELDEVAEGKLKWVPLIKQFYVPFEKTLEVKEKELKKNEITNLGESDEKCPECGSVLIYKLGKYGKFLSCSKYPKCKYAKPVADAVAKEGGDGGGNSEETADYGKCPNCGDGAFVLKHGKFGKFLACSNYPKCKTTKTYLDKVGTKCPGCGEGDVIVKKVRGRKFFGCSRYPDCKWSGWKNPAEKEESQKEKDEPAREKITTLI